MFTLNIYSHLISYQGNEETNFNVYTTKGCHMTCVMTQVLITYDTKFYYHDVALLAILSDICKILRYDT